MSFHWHRLSQKRLRPRWIYQVIGVWESEADRLGGADPIHTFDIKVGAGLLSGNMGRQTRRPNNVLRRTEWKLEGQDVWKIHSRSPEELADTDKFIQPGDVIERVLYTPAEMAVLRPAFLKKIIEDHIEAHPEEMRNPSKRNKVEGRLFFEKEVGVLPDDILNMPVKGVR